MIRVQCSPSRHLTLIRTEISTHSDIVHAHHPRAVVHVLFQVSVHVFKYQREGDVCVDDVMEQHNVGMLQVL